MCCSKKYFTLLLNSCNFSNLFIVPGNLLNNVIPTFPLLFLTTVVLQNWVWKSDFWRVQWSWTVYENTVKCSLRPGAVSDSNRSVRCTQTDNHHSAFASHLRGKVCQDPKAVSNLQLLCLTITCSTSTWPWISTDHESNSSPSFITTVPAFSTTANTITLHKALRTASGTLVKATDHLKAFTCCVNFKGVSTSSSDRSEGDFSRHSRIVSRTVKLSILSALSSSSPESRQWAL
jgi:hypothetical protein